MDITISNITIEELKAITEALTAGKKQEVKLEKVKAESVPVPVPKVVKAKPVKPVIPDGMISKLQIAKNIGVTTQNVGIWIKRGCPATRVGSKWYLNESDTRAWVAKNINKTKASPKKKDEGDFTTWQRKMFSIIDGKGMDRGKACSRVFSQMTKVYGIVWDQVKKEYFRDYGHKCPSTMQACYYLQTRDSEGCYEHLFDNLLLDLEKEAC